MPSTSGVKRPRPGGKAPAGAAAGKPGRGGRSASGAPPAKRASKALDEEIVFDGGSDSDFEADRDDREDVGAAVAEVEEETADAKRLRLAQEVLSRYSAEAAKGDDESSDEEGGDDDGGAARLGLHLRDAVSARLRQEALIASGALYRPLARLILDAGGIPATDVCFKRGHHASATCVAVSDDGHHVFTGSKDCSIIRWHTAEFVEGAPADAPAGAPAAAAAAAAGATASTGAVAAPSTAAGSSSATAALAGAAASATAPAAADGVAALPLPRVVFPGRRKTAADATAQQRAAEMTRAAWAGDRGGGSAAAGNASGYTGLRPVISLGYGGGRIGSTTAMTGAQAAAAIAAGGAPGAATSASAAASKVVHAEGVSSIIFTRTDTTGKGKGKGKGGAAGGAGRGRVAGGDKAAFGGRKGRKEDDADADGEEEEEEEDGSGSDGGEEAAAARETRAEATAEKRARNRTVASRMRSVPDYPRTTGHWDEVLALTLSSDGAYLASGGRDGFVRVWDALSGRPHQAQGPRAAAPAAAAAAAAAGSSASASSASSSSPSSSSAGAAVASSAGGSASTRAGVSASGPASASAAASAAVVNVDNFVGHKGAVTGVAFRRGSHALYSASADRTVRVWNVDELSFNDTLFGHEGEVTAILAMGSAGKDRCLTAGRDRTVRQWRVSEQKQLVFRADASDVSTDCVAAISDWWFVSGAADGTLALWHASRKRPVIAVRQAHGDGSKPTREARRAFKVVTGSADAGAAAATAAVASAGVPLEGMAPTNGKVTAKDLPIVCAATGIDAGDTLALSAGFCHGITALAVCPGSTLFASGSGDGFIRLWRLLTPAAAAAAQRAAAASGGGHHDDDEAEHDLIPASEAGRPTAFVAVQQVAAIPVKGIVNGLSFSHDGRVLAAAVGQEHRLGRWWHYKHARNGLMLIRMPQLPKA